MGGSSVVKYGIANADFASSRFLGLNASRPSTRLSAPGDSMLHSCRRRRLCGQPGCEASAVKEGRT